ncbi:MULTISPECIES: RraA family protein [Sphingobium]|uniref:RraA family protein n=1 Tax=Sphingobium TaxID=165695 RepID=UPI00159C6488|nr:RraA family protein [Sphingobium sp. 15-1]
MTKPDIAERLVTFDSCTISDTLDQLGLPGAVAGLQPMTLPGRRIAGRVMTVKLGPPLEGLPKRHLGAGAVMAAAAGDVIVVEHARTDVSGWGGLLSRGAVRKGIAAVIVDGGCRDVDESRELGLPVFARSAVPITARGRVAEHDFDCPITISGVAVNPGDFVVADGSGAVFVAATEVERVLAAASRIASREALMARDIEAGRPIGDVMGADYEDMLKTEKSE